MTAPQPSAVVAGLGSATANPTVVQLAAREAAAHGRPLRLLHAFNWAAALASPSPIGPRAEAELLIEEATGIAHEVAPVVPVSGDLVEGGAVDALIRRSASAFLTVLGDGGMAHCPDCVPADAPAVQVAARAESPVLVVRREPPPPGPVLVGLDGSASSRTALDFAFDCAARRSARVLAVRVIEPDRPDADATAHLTEAVADCGRRYPSVGAECHTIHGDPGTVLLDQSRSAQLAVVAARGDEPWRGLLGAVSQSLLYHSPAPVLVVRGLAETPTA
ncbi:universal stress protein [Micromonospora yangpuensis]|uniref:Nucleotide-binding universal stress protein, UspA family n=1 Tax=Micromonospora yangpuensis TaxID=683228 RepID=A0A1C6UES7_9ACTN|nr:universal stress protein [Micromonospora yangpuensis]GGM32180.1 universal stress protein [Micromonospora yangpuensis]SCL52403.1 Nucleotide-binding universal stress protein, UspA family [Micromonospora yangpuensis]